MLNFAKRTFLFFMLPVSVWAASLENLISDRPGQAFSYQVVGEGVWQLQSGLDFSETKGLAKTSVNNTNHFLRFGVTDSLELVSAFAYSQVRSGGPNLDGVSDLQLGVRKTVFSEAKGFQPALGVLTLFKMPWVSNPFRGFEMAPSIRVSMVHSLTHRLSWTNNIGVDYDGVAVTPSYLFVSNFGYSLSEKWSAFIETYGRERSGRDYLFFDGGVAYLMNPNVQWDFYGGGGKNHGLEESFVSAGVTWRIQ